MKAAGELHLILADIVRELDQPGLVASQVKHTQTNKPPINITCMFLERVKKQKEIEKTHTSTGSTCKLRTGEVDVLPFKKSVWVKKGNADYIIS